MRRPTRFKIARVLACSFAAQACTSYGPQLEPLRPADRFRVVADSPFTVVTAGRDHVPTGSCRATKVIGRVLEVHGDTLVVGGSPIISPAPGAGCEVAAIAIFAAPPNVNDVDVRRPDTAKTVWALGIGAFALYAIDALLHAAFPET